MKSPRDDYIFEMPADGGPAIREDIPFYRKLGKHVRDAAAQLEAVNKGHKLPNIVAFVSHSSSIERQDLLATIAGLSRPGKRPVFMLSKVAQAKVIAAAQKIDLLLWIDAEKRALQHLSPRGALHQKAALNLLGLANNVSAS